MTKDEMREMARAYGARDSTVRVWRNNGVSFERETGEHVWCLYKTEIATLKTGLINLPKSKTQIRLYIFNKDTYDTRTTANALREFASLMHLPLTFEMRKGKIGLVILSTLEFVNFGAKAGFSQYICTELGNNRVLETSVAQVMSDLGTVHHVHQHRI